MALSRRKAVQHLLGGSLALGLSPYAYSLDDSLPFRRGKKLLHLNFNENAGGMSPLAKEAADKAVRDFHNRYPDPQMAALKQALAEKHKVGENQIILGNGSTEILQLTLLAAAQDGATLIDAETTYGQVRADAARWGMKIAAIPLRENFTTDVNAMETAANAINGPVLINLCNPNNPTGTIIPADELAAWIDRAPENHTFLMDEAYFDYAISETANYGTMLPLVKSGRDNLVIARTFSKVHGMAGLRVGYGIATAVTAERISGFSNGININVAGAAAALASLKDVKFYKASLANNRLSKSMLIKALDELGLEHVPSSTNFVLHRVNSSITSYQRRMRENNILVGRRMTKQDGWNRLSLGTLEQMQEFVQTLHTFRKRGWA